MGDDDNELGIMAGQQPTMLGVCYGTEGLRDCRKGGTVGTRHSARALLCSAALVWRAGAPQSL